jgi:hypothetical protein
MKVSDSRNAGGESEGSVDEGEWEQRGRVRVRARVRVRVRVRMRRNLRDRGCMDCADVEIEPLALLLHRTELFIVAEALGMASRTDLCSHCRRTLSCCCPMRATSALPRCRTIDREAWACRRNTRGESAGA